MKLDLTRFENLKGNDKYMQYLRVVKSIAQLENYKKELAKDLMPLIDSKADKMVVTPMGTIQLIGESIRETLDKNKVIDMLGLEKVQECMKTSKVSASLRVSLKNN